MAWNRKTNTIKKMRYSLKCSNKCPFILRCEKNIVYPDGRIGGLMVIGEAPGKTELTAGHGFAGIAGNNLMSALSAAGFDTGTLMNPNFYRTNIVLCNPVDNAGKNRKPSASEMRSCEKNLTMAIEQAKPRVILAVGETSASALGMVDHGVKFLDQCVRPVEKKIDGIPAFFIPHTSPLCWNRNYNGMKIKDIGVNIIKKAIKKL